MWRSLAHWRRCNIFQNTWRSRSSIQIPSSRRPYLVLPYSQAASSRAICRHRWISTAPGRQLDRRVQSSNEDTIYALSTAPGRAAIAIVRASGPACLDIYRSLCPGKADPKPRHATLRSLYRPQRAAGSREILDSNALVFYFPTPKTVTGEDVLELHIHGGPAVIKAVLKSITESVTQNDQSQGIRYAEPGEFTKRAFYNDRLDLTQVEALGDTLAAETEQQRRLAVNGSTSSLADKYDAWQQKLLFARGELEALIDFSEDQHFDESPGALCASVATQVQALQRNLRASIEGAAKGELLRRGISVALVGPPNAGKSSLLNRIIGREAAIVSSQAGTTRDVIEVNVDIGGYLCRFLDLAGLRILDSTQVSGASIEQEGMRRASSEASKADLVIAFLSSEHDTRSTKKMDGFDGGIPEGESLPLRLHLDSNVHQLLDERRSNDRKSVLVMNKTDLFSDQSEIKAACVHFERARLESGSSENIIPISCLEATPAGPGVEPLLRSLTNIFHEMTEQVVPIELARSGSDSFWVESFGATERQRVLLEQCLHHLEDFLAEVHQPTIEGQHVTLREDDEIDIVLAAEHLRSAASCLAKITGKGEMSGDVEAVLGVVFERFCVGK